MLTELSINDTASLNDWTPKVPDNDSFFRLDEISTILNLYFDGAGVGIEGYEISPFARNNLTIEWLNVLKNSIFREYHYARD